MSNLARRRPGVLLALALVALGCFLLAACALAGLALLRGAIPDLDVVAVVEPTPLATPAQRDALAAEKETAAILRTADMPQRDLVDLARRLGGLAELPERNVTVPQYEVGDSLEFWVHDLAADEYARQTAILRFETAHAYWWVQADYAVSHDNLARSAGRFEEQTYPTLRRLFGSEPLPGIDNDPHVYLFLGHVPGVAGYFSGPDEYPQAVRAYSNEHEMFYINLDHTGADSDYFDGILAHEFQHMIHWAMDRDEDTWINEGLSELAADVAGYDAGGSDQIFAASPDTQLTSWPELEDSAANYGASYLFISYLRERYGDGAITQLVAEQANGIAGVEAVLASVDPGKTFDVLLADWVIANYLDDDEAGDGAYGYSSLSIRRPIHSARHPTTPIENRARVNQYAADYILITAPGDVIVEFEGSTLVPVIGNQVHGGQYQWCSLRGDEGDATLTRAFDLSGVTQATLSAWTWYDLETDYDYGYAAASTDGGQTWTLLSSEDTTTRDPNKSSYGPAFTGMSGGGTEARWTQQHFDLTPYSGGQVLVRFEVITDESVNRPGMCIDDLALPEIGFVDGAEQDAGQWTAAGWVRITSNIPQDFVVQLITFRDDEASVAPVGLSSQNRGLVTIDGLGDEVDRAVLVVAAVAPATSSPATYNYRFTTSEGVRLPTRPPARGVAVLPSWR